MAKTYIQALYVVLEFTKEVPMGKIIYQLPNLGESENFGHDPASRLAACSQVSKIHKSFENMTQNLREL